MYDDIYSDSGQFRLLTLHPGRSGDHLVCTLSIASLEQIPCPLYETISYHWGGQSLDVRRDSVLLDAETQQRYIEILGRRINVPVRAAQALRCMRLLDKPRVLWIDSICIDQQNIEEREQQIAIMGKIYRSGTRNLIYLGNGDEQEARAGVDALRSAHQQLQTELGLLPEAVRRQWEEHRIKPKGWEKIEKPPVLLADPQPLKLMFNCAWFSRLWVVQEVCLASRNLCHWANQKFDLQELMDVVHISRELEVSGDADPPEMYKHYCCLQQLRYLLPLSEQFRTGRLHDPIEALMSLVDILRHCDVAHDQDRIYAIVGLLRSLPGCTEAVEQLLQADYHKSRTDVFRDATRAILLLSCTDDLLSKVSHRNASELLDTAKPSWSFYWNRPQDMVYEPGRPTLFTSFHAGIANRNQMPENALIMTGKDAEPEILAFRGFLLGSTLQFLRHLSKGILIKDCVALCNLIEAIGEMSKAEPRLEDHWDFRPGPASEGCIESRTKAELLRAREVGRANEIVRRRLIRKVGDLQIAEYSKQGEANSALPAGPLCSAAMDPTKDLNDMTSMTVLTAGWWEAQFGDAQSALRAFRDLYAHIKRYNELPKMLSNAFDMYITLCTASNNRSFFTTACGLVGCGPRIMEALDTIAVFHGAKYPYVLRKASPFDGTYRFVGMAIIPAIMHGQVFKRELLTEEIRLR